MENHICKKELNKTLSKSIFDIIKTTIISGILLFAFASVFINLPEVYQQQVNDFLNNIISIGVKFIESVVGRQYTVMTIILLLALGLHLTNKIIDLIFDQCNKNKLQNQS